MKNEIIKVCLPASARLYPPAFMPCDPEAQPQVGNSIFKYHILGVNIKFKSEPVNPV
jgi:hypothetical protein